MNIGEKIKKLRKAKLMTQAELAGNEITRNMLSQIENGVATPSLATISYIANRLNVSTGYLMANAEDEQIYYKYNEISDIKKSYMSGDFRICRDMCAHAKSGDDDEIKLIHSECSLEIGREEFNRGNLREACLYFDEAIENCANTIYHTGYIVAIAGMYFKYMNAISGTLEANSLDVEKINIYPALTDEFCLYAFLLEGNSPQFDISALNGEGPYAMHLSAKKYMEQRDFDKAHTLLHDILYSEMEVPQPILYSVICDLEVCCKELNDYKSAYEYSNEKLSALQKLLS